MKKQPGPLGRVGLSLSGGGFRASFFHLGVLRRLAELDVLREVGVLSTVSGGSILAALYYLRLKERLDDRDGLTSADYVQIIDEVENDLRAGVRENLRTRLVFGLCASLRHTFPFVSFCRRIVHLYDRFVFRPVHRALAKGDSRYDGGIPLSVAKVEERARAQNAHVVFQDLERRNRHATDKIPKLVVNSTSLNSGRPFRFMLAEIGDPELGYIRFDEVELVLLYKRALDSDEERLWQAIRDARVESFRGVSPEGPWKKHAEWIGAHAARHARWWRWMETGSRGEGNVGMVVDVIGRSETVAHALSDGDLGCLRVAKISAWYLLLMAGEKSGELLDGRSIEEHEQRLWNALTAINADASALLQEDFARDGKLLAFCDFLLDLYYLRSARAFSKDMPSVLKKITLTQAVAASANFPPLFSPFRISRLYDRKRISQLRLTDGGVYDNLGLDALLEEGCTTVIASDAGGMLKPQPKPAIYRILMMVRIIDTFMGDIRARQFDFARFLGGLWKRHPELGYGLPRLAFFHLESRPGDVSVEAKRQLAASGQPAPLPEHPAWKSIAAVRTDLDVFSDSEMDCLVYQGYQLCDRFVRTYVLPAGSAVPPPTLVLPSDGETTRQARVLGQSNRSVLRGFRLYWQGKALFLAVALALLVSGGFVFCNSPWWGRLLWTYAAYLGVGTGMFLGGKLLLALDRNRGLR